MSFLGMAIKLIPGAGDFIEDLRENPQVYEKKVTDFIGKIPANEGETPVIMMLPVNGSVYLVSGVCDGNNLFTQRPMEFNGKKVASVPLKDIVLSLLNEVGL
jgi:hypothetical protein